MPRSPRRPPVIIAMTGPRHPMSPLSLIATIEDDPLTGIDFTD